MWCSGLIVDGQCPKMNLDDVEYLAMGKKNEMYIKDWQVKQAIWLLVSKFVSFDDCCLRLENVKFLYGIKDLLTR